MKIAVLIFSWFSIGLGSLAILGGFIPAEDGTYDPYAFIGGFLFLIQGLLTVIYVMTREDDDV